MRIDHQREHLLHAALEGVAFGIRAALEALPDASKATILRLAGGGSIHAGWRQMLADILGRTLIAVFTPDASARGAALLAGIATGIWPDAAATAPLAPGTQVVAVPDPGKVAHYTDLYEHYQRLAL